MAAYSSHYVAFLVDPHPLVRDKDTWLSSKHQVSQRTDNIQAGKTLPVHKDSGKYPENSIKFKENPKKSLRFIK